MLSAMFDVCLERLRSKSFVEDGMKCKQKKWGQYETDLTVSEGTLMVPSSKFTSTWETFTVSIFHHFVVFLLLLFVHYLRFCQTFFITAAIFICLAITITIQIACLPSTNFRLLV